MKWKVKEYALQRGQDQWFTPPQVGCVLSAVELLWVSEKRKYKRLPAAERRKDSDALRALLDCLKSRSDVTAYIHKPAQYTRAMLVAARDGEQVRETGKPDGSKPLLLPELFQALRQFGATPSRRGRAI